MKAALDCAADFISKVGFPIFVSIILLWRDDQRHHENVTAIRHLVTAVNRKRCGRT